MHVTTASPKSCSIKLPGLDQGLRVHSEDRDGSFLCKSSKHAGAFQRIVSRNRSSDIEHLGRKWLGKCWAMAFLSPIWQPAETSRQVHSILDLSCCSKANDGLNTPLIHYVYFGGLAESRRPYTREHHAALPARARQNITSVVSMVS